MTLTQTLQLKEKFLKYEDLRALNHCETRWVEAGCPTERWAMVNFLERMLKELQIRGTGYPKVLLLRKKEIQRKEFVPSATAEPEAPAAPVCPLCKGSGWQPVHYPGSAPSYRACTCDAAKEVTA